MTGMSPSLRGFLLLLATLLVFVLWVGRPDLAGSHEARVAQVARRMAASGWPWQAQSVSVPRVELGKLADGSLRLLPSHAGEGAAATIDVNPWLIPIYQGQIRLQKPPLPAWTAAGCFLLLGVSEWSARVIPAVLGAAGVLIFWSLATQLLGRRGGWLAAWVFLTSYFVPQEYRKLMADPFLAFFTLLCVWAWVMASRRQSEGWHLLFYASLALGALAKGPPVFLQVAIPLLAYHGCYRARLPRLWISHVAGALLFLAIALPWPAYVLRHVPGAVDIWRYESVGELGENTENARPFWFYLPNLFNLALPWTPLWVVALAYPLQRRRRRLWLGWIWCIATVVFFSFVNLKKDAYLLPMMPAMALMVAPVLRRVLAMRRRTVTVDAWRMAAWGQAIVGAAAAGTLAWLLRASVLASGASVVVALVSLLTPHWPRRWLVLQIGAYTALAALYVSFYRAGINAQSPRDFAPAMIHFAEVAHQPILGATLSEGMGFYLPLELPLWHGESSALAAVPPAVKQPLDWRGWCRDKLGREVLAATEVPLGNIKDMRGWRLLQVEMPPRH